MTDKEQELRFTMWEATKALWPVILLIVAFFGTTLSIVYARAEFAVSLARETDKVVAQCYVAKVDYEIDRTETNNKLELLDSKIDYLIQLELQKKSTLTDSP